MSISNIPTFRVPAGAASESLIACFLDRIILNLSCPPATLIPRNGFEYTAIYDNVSVNQLSPVTPVIISYQRHRHGNFAVIRVLYQAPEAPELPANPNIL